MCIFLICAISEYKHIAVILFLKENLLKTSIHKAFSFEEIGKARLKVETNRDIDKVVVNI